MNANADPAFTPSVSLSQEALDHMPAGVLTVNEQGDITYANSEFCRIVGLPSCTGVNIRRIFSDDQDYAKVSDNLKARFTTRVGNDYRVEVTHQPDGIKVPINIIAVPQVGDAGIVVGSFAFIKDMTLETTADRIHTQIEAMRDWHQILQAITLELADLISFDYFVVQLYSSDHRHTRMLFTYSPEVEQQWGVRWFELPNIALRLIEQREPIIIDNFYELLNQPEWVEVKHDPTTKKFLARGYRSCLWYPIVASDRLAGITLYSKRAQAFREGDKKILETLPLRRAISMAMHYLERDDQRFRLNLMHEIAACGADPKVAAALLVKRISDHYDWDNVSLFRVNEDKRNFELLAQNFTSKEYEFPCAYAQPMHEGVLGYVYNTKHHAISGDVHSDPLFRQYFKQGVRATVMSELAIPIVVDGKVCAILNSEDNRRNAYADAERRGLETVLHEVSVLFQRLELQHLLNAIQEATKDAIIRTDSNGTIRQINPATTALLGYRDHELVGTSVTQYFRDKQLAACFIRADHPPGDQVDLVAKDGQHVAVLLSGALLPTHIGGRVYTATDLSWRQRVERLECLRDMYRELGDQAHAPLSLCFIWLKRLLRATTSDENETLEKVFRQLKKVQLTFDRLSLFEREGTTMPFNPVLISVPYIVDGIISELPEDDRSHVNLLYATDLPSIRGDVFQLSFCLTSTLSYLLQCAPQNEKVSINVHSDDRYVKITVRGKAPNIDAPELPHQAHENWLAHALFEVAIGADTLRRFTKQHGGTFEGPRRDGQEEEYIFVLPSAHRDT
jgi:PAS domain S-box-containing protein